MAASAAVALVGTGSSSHQSHHLHKPTLAMCRRVPVFLTMAVAPPRQVASSLPAAEGPQVELQKGGKMMADLVGAFTELTERMDPLSLTSSSQRLLFKTLKLAIPLLRGAAPAADGRKRLSRALTVGFLLADLQMDAEVISAGILREALETGSIVLHDVEVNVGIGTAHLLQESLRIRHAAAKLCCLDDESSAELRRFCLTYYDIRALVLELALKRDTMRYLNHLPKYLQQIISLQVMKIYAPLAHAVGAGAVSMELEDLSFQYLFPTSYSYVDAWLRNREPESRTLMEHCKEQLLQALKADPELNETVGSIVIRGRYKSRFSTMKKLLKDGRRPEEINDVLGLRVILDGTHSNDDLLSDWGPRACYRTQEIIRELWREVPGRTKDYIARPKPNGYMSLHVAVDVTEPGKAWPLMEIQIRTAEMDKAAAGGTSSHSLYKGGFTDPAEATRLKAIMMAAAELAALRLSDLPSGDHPEGLPVGSRNQAFGLLDKNGDGKISIEELREVMEELGAGGDDADELMHLLDSNNDGSLSSEEFEQFQRQVQMRRNLEDKDDLCAAMLKEKLQMIDQSGLIQVYRKQLGAMLAAN